MHQPDPDKAKVKKTRPGRLCRMLGWTLLSLGLLVAGVWVASRWWGAERGGGTPQRRNLVRVASGEVFVGFSSPSGPGDQAMAGTRWRLERLIASDRYWVWWYGWEDNGVFNRRGVGLIFNAWPAGVPVRRYHLALWPIPLLLWTPAALFLRSGIIAQRRAVKGTCGKCGYDLAGLGADASCPECGKTRQAADQRG